MNLPFLRRTALTMAVVFGVAACDQKPATTAQATPPAPAAPADAAPPAMTPATAAAMSGKVEVAFGEGFHKEEASEKSSLRWVRQSSALRIAAPAAGRYRLTFRPFTVFTTTENTVDVNVNGLPAGSFSTHAFDTANPAPATVEVSLRAGDNDLHLHSRGAEVRLGENDDRMAAFGLVLPVGVEPVP